MTGSKQFPNSEEILAGYVLGNLEPEEVEQVKQQLEANPELQAQVSKLQETLALMPYGLPQSNPPPGLRDRILQASSQCEQVPVSQTKSFFRRDRLSFAFGSIAALLALMLGWDSYRLRGQLAATQFELAQQQDLVALLRSPNNRLISLAGMNAAQSASGSLMIAPYGEKAVLAVKNLQPLPQGKTYRLWAVSNGKKIGCGKFAPNAEGTVFLELSLEGLQTATEVVVTIEPTPGPSQPTGAMVMTSTL